MLTIRQVAERLGIHYHTARSWVVSGRLPSVAFGPRTRRVPAAALERLVHHLTTGGN